MGYFAWVLIPLAAILVGGFKEWLKFKSKQEKIGTSTHELEGTVTTLREVLNASEQERERLAERVENLETIVTSQVWDALHEQDEPRVLGDGCTASTSGKALPEPGEPEKTEELARRVQKNDAAR